MAFPRFSVFLFRGCLAAILLWAPPGIRLSAASGAGGSGPEILLLCQGGDAACSVLEDALGAALGQQAGRPVTQLARVPGTLAPNTWLVRYHPELDGPSLLRGHLSWQGADGVQGRGPSLELARMDATLDRQGAADFATFLSRASGLPF